MVSKFIKMSRTWLICDQKYFEQKEAILNLLPGKIMNIS